MSPNFSWGFWMFRSSIMKSDCWKCGKCVSSWIWGVHIYDDDCNILGASYSTLTYEPMIWGRLLKILCPSAERWPETNQLALCKGLQEQAKKERDFHSKIRARDENWVYGYVPGTNQQSSQWRSHPPAILESWGRWSQTSWACCPLGTVRHFFSFFFSARLWINTSV